MATDRERQSGHSLAVPGGVWPAVSRGAILRWRRPVGGPSHRLFGKPGFFGGAKSLIKYYTKPILVELISSAPTTPASEVGDP